jgi:restriction modification system DNA specificity domain protein
VKDFLFTDLISFVGEAPKKFDGYKKYVSTGAVNGNIIESDDIELVDYSSRPSRANLVACSGDILFAKMAETEKTLLLDDETEKNIYSTGFCAIRAKENIIEPKALYYLLGSSLFLNQKNTNSSGATQRAITNTGLSKIRIKLPTMEKQREFCGIMDKVVDSIELRKKQLGYFDELTKSLFIEMFGDPISNPKEWKKKKCKNILTKIGSGATPQGGSESYKEEGISLIRSMNVHNGRFESKDLAYIDEKQAQKLDNVNIKENDVLINITGASVARCCIVPSDVIPARVNQHVSVLRCSDMVNSIFLCYQIINDSYQNLLKKIGTSGGATREAITKKQIEDLEVILPPIELQNKFANFVRGTDKSKLAVKKSLEELEILKKSLMQKYFA